MSDFLNIVQNQNRLKFQHNRSGPNLCTGLHMHVAAPDNLINYIYIVRICEWGCKTGQICTQILTNISNSKLAMQLGLPVLYVF